MSIPRSTASAIVAAVVAGGLLAVPTVSHAVLKKESKKQAFSKKSAFIDFSKLGKLKEPKGEKLKSLGRVKFKSIKPKGKRAPQKDAIIKFGAPVDVPNGGTTVDIELVSLSLVSVSPVSLEPLGGDGEGLVRLSLGVQQASQGLGIITFDDDKKKTGKFDSKFDKYLKLKSKNDPKKKTPILDGKNKLPVSFDNVPFSQQSPITVTAPFCFGTADAAEFCLSPLSAVPEPPNVLLLSLGLGGIVVLVGYGRRRALAA